MATIKYRPDELRITFQLNRNGTVTALYSAKAWSPQTDVPDAASAREIRGDKLLTMAQFNALIDSGSAAFKATIKGYIEAQIPDKFGTGHTIEEDNS